MKTGSFIMPSLLSAGCLKKVAGGVNPFQPNIPYPTNNNIASVNVGVSPGPNNNLNFQYQIGINIPIADNANIFASAQGNQQNAINNVGFTFSLDQ